jgi:hypothetical protein
MSIKEIARYSRREKNCKIQVEYKGVFYVKPLS